MFGSRDGISARRVQHDDAAAGRCLDIDVIHSDTGAAHDTQFVTGIQNFGGDFGLAAHHQRAERRNQLDEFALVQAGFDRDLQRVLAREFVHSALRNGIGDEDLRRSHFPCALNKRHSERSRGIPWHNSRVTSRDVSTSLDMTVFSKPGALKS